MSCNENVAIFLDRDGTIIEDRGHLRDPSEVIFFPEAFEALRRLQEHFLLFIVTNQTGIAEGSIGHGDADLVNRAVIAALSAGGIEVTDVYVCPHRRSDNCQCIKPKPYFLKRAAGLYGLDLKRSFTVGDHPHDIELAKNVGARGIYVLTGHGRKHLDELPEDAEIASGMMEAADTIMSHHTVRMGGQECKQMEAEFVLNLTVAHDLWRRPDLGHEPRDAKHVAKILREAGIRVHLVSGGWLECEPRPVGICEALSGKLPDSDWATQFNCPPEQPSRVLRLLVQKGIPVCNPQISLLEKNLQGARE